MAQKFRRIEKATRTVIQLCRQGKIASRSVFWELTFLNGTLEARLAWPYRCDCGLWQYSCHCSSPAKRLFFSQCDYWNTAPLERRYSASLFATAVIHASVVAKLADCGMSDVFEFCTHVSSELFRVTSKLLQKTKNMNIEKSHRTTLIENLATTCFLAYFPLRYWDFHFRKALSPPMSLSSSSRPCWKYSPLRNDLNIDNLDFMPVSQSTINKQGLDSIVSDQRWAHLRSYAAHWLEKLYQDRHWRLLAMDDLNNMCRVGFRINEDDNTS